MSETAISWEQIHKEAAQVADKVSAIRQITGWSEEGSEDHLDRIQEQCQLSDSTEALNVLLEVCLMRRYLHISEELSEELKLDITVTMWIRRWSADDFKQALGEVFSRLALVPTTAANGIAVLLEIAVIYRKLKSPSIWPTRKDRGRCAELMYLVKLDEDTVHLQMRRSLERFGFGKGNESAALESLREIELLYRRTRFDDNIPEQIRRTIVETMWLRHWAAEETLQNIAALQNRLALHGNAAAIRAIHEISLLFGPRDHSGPVVDAAKRLCFDQILRPAVLENARAMLAEYIWVGGYSVGQAMEKIGRFARVNNAALLETLEVLSQLERERFRENASTPSDGHT